VIPSAAIWLLGGQHPSRACQLDVYNSSNVLVFSNIQTESISPGKVDTVSFPRFDPSPGQWRYVASVSIPGDTYPADDTFSRWVEVLPSSVMEPEPPSDCDFSPTRDLPQSDPGARRFGIPCGRPASSA